MPLGTSVVRRALTAALAGGLATGLAVGAAGGPASARAEVWAVPPSATVTVSGHGFGHGHGMSQWGAEGAGRQGVQAAQILDFYYPGTATGSARGPIRVLVTEGRRVVTVQAVPGLVVRRLGEKRTTIKVAQLRPRATAWRIKPLSGGRTEVSSRGGTGGGWRKLTGFRGDAELKAPGRTLDLLARGERTAYRGALRSTGGQTVNVVPLEAYLRGVVPLEVPSTWTPAALQAQAVAARTYAAFERASVSSARTYDVHDTTRSQVYGGRDAEQASTDAAIAATRGQVRTAGGAPAFTQFSASNGGWTSAGSQPYLVARQDPWDAAGGANPHTSWSVPVSDRTIEARWPQVGDLTQLAVEGRDGNGDLGGRADVVVLTGTAGTVRVTGESFRFVLGLKSDWFTFSVA